MKHGFTLIELLVVIAIVGLLSSVALANYQSARQKANEAAGKQFSTLIRSGLGDKLVSTWDLDDDYSVSLLGEGETVAKDSSGNLDGEAFNVSHVDDGVDAGGSSYFDGSAYIWGSHFPNPGLNGGFAVSAWIKPEDIIGLHTIFALEDGGDNTCTGFTVGISNGKASVNGIDATSYIIKNNIWQNIVFNFKNDPTNGPTVETYLNGAKVGSVTGVGTGNCPDGNWSIGADVTFDSEGGTGEAMNGFVGAIDIVNTYQGAF